MGAHVYMLRCADGSFYVGSATGEDLTLRIAQHQAGTFEGYTSLRRPVELVWVFRPDHGRDCDRAKDQGLEPGEEGSADKRRLGVYPAAGEAAGRQA
jgi:hypothetical protein